VRPFDPVYLPYVKNTSSTAVTDNLQPEDVVEDSELMQDAERVENPQQNNLRSDQTLQPRLPSASEVTAEIKPARPANAP
jgi:hypothetical protein